MRKDQSRLLAYEYDAILDINSQNSKEIDGLLQTIRDNETVEADLREQIAQLTAELEGANHNNQILEGERKVVEIQVKVLLAGHETLLSWQRTQKALLESEAAKATQSGRQSDGDFA